MSKKTNKNLIIIIGVLCSTLIITVTFLGISLNHNHENDNESNTRIMGRSLPHFESYKMPETLTFAGEDVPIGRFDVRQKLDKELTINAYANSKMILVLKRREIWFPQYKEILDKYGIPEDLIYIAVAESGLENVVSPVNAKGHWQIMKGTAKEYGLVVNTEIDERYHQLKSAEVACKYLKNAYKRLGTWTLATAAYNRGVSGMKKAIKHQNVNNYYDLKLNSETSRYLFRVLAFKILFQDLERYGYKKKLEHIDFPPQTKKVVITNNVDDVVAYAESLGITYNMLKTLNPWIITQTGISVGTKDNQRSEYVIEIPREKV